MNVSLRTNVSHRLLDQRRWTIHTASRRVPVGGHAQPQAKQSVSPVASQPPTGPTVICLETQRVTRKEDAQREANARYRQTEQGRASRAAAHKRYRASQAGKANAAKRAALDAEYAAVHQLLKRDRGRASEHPCIDCGETAQEWSFDQPTGHSTDLSRYHARCRRCHARFDRA